MAIQVSTTFCGLAVPTAYCRIGRMYISDKTHCVAYLAIYADAVAAAAGSIPPLSEEVVVFIYDLSSALPLNAQAYAAAKADPARAECVDV